MCGASYVTRERVEALAVGPLVVHQRGDKIGASAASGSAPAGEVWRARSGPRAVREPGVKLGGNVGHVVSDAMASVSVQR
jgi:hypothetical protein